MKSITALVCLSMAVSLAAGAILGDYYDAYRTRLLQPALRHREIHDPVGQYAMDYVAPQGSARSEQGHYVLTPTGYVMETQGQYSFVGTDGKTYTVRYVAGPDGFKAEGDHLPKAPLPVV